jgi:hypothetical protein
MDDFMDGWNTQIIVQHGIDYYTMGRRLLLVEFLIEPAVRLLCLTWKHSPTIQCRRTIWVQLLFCRAGVYSPWKRKEY